MPLRIALALALALLASACAAPRQPPVVERLSPTDLARLAPAPNPRLSLADVVFLTKETVPPAVIIRRLDETGTILALTPAQIVDLSRQGVDQSVIDHIVATHEKARQATLAGEIAARDAQAADHVARERARRLALEHDRAWNWGIGYGRFGPSWGLQWGRPYPFGRYYPWRPW